MVQTFASADPLANTWGLMPRYWRERQAAAAAALAAARAATPAGAAAVALPDPFAALRPVDAGTADLRRRLAACRPAPRATRAVAAPALASAAFLFGLAGHD